MRKIVATIIITSIHLVLFSQHMDESNKELLEEYRWGTGFRDTTISMNVYLELKNSFKDEWLMYRMTTNPEYSREDWYDRERKRHKDYCSFVLGDTVDCLKYYLNFTIKKWPVDDDPLKKNFPMEKNIPWENFYLIEKKRNLFIDYCPDSTLGCQTDTIEIDGQSKYFPHDERFLVYYDPVKEPFKPRWLSGNVHWNALPYPYNNYWAEMPLIRLAQYGVEWLKLYHPEHPELYHNHFPDENDYKYFVAQKSLLTDGYLWIKVKKGLEERDKQYEMIYFTDRPEKTGDSTRQTMRKYHYTIKPGWHEDVRERYPEITDYKKMSPEYVRDIWDSPFRILPEGALDEEPPEDDPADIENETEQK